MRKNKIFITSGVALDDPNKNWRSVCKEKLNCELYDLTEKNISNALISRKLIHKVNELIKTHNPEDMVVGIMWTIPDIHERYIDDNKINNNSIGVVGGIKNWRILNYESISHSEDCKLYFEIFYNWLQSYVLSLEHILKTQWFLKRLGIKYFMTSNIDIFNSEENYSKMFSKLKNRKKYNLQILSYSEVVYLFDMLQKSTFLPIDGMLEWIQENYIDEGFDDSEKMIPNSLGHEKFATEVILPFLNKTYEIDLLWG